MARKALSAFIAFALLLSSCGGGQAKQGQGRYEEYDVTPPALSSYKTFMLSGNRLECVQEDGKARYESLDQGKTWKEYPGFSPNGATGIGAFELMDDLSVIAYIEGKGLTRFSEAGEETHIPIAELDSEGSQVSVRQIAALIEGSFLLGLTQGGGQMIANPGQNGGAPSQRSNSTQNAPGQGTQNSTLSAPGQGAQNSTQNAPGQGSQNSAQAPNGGQTAVGFRGASWAIYGGGGGKIADLDSQNGTSCAIDSSFIYIIDPQGQVTSYNKADGKKNQGQQRTLNASGSMGLSSNSSTAALAGSLYYLRGSTLYEMDALGSEKAILNGAAYAFGSPTAQIQSVIATATGAVIAIGASSGRDVAKLYSYEWDPSYVADESKTLYIWSLEDSPTVRAAIGEFRASHPGWAVDYEAALSQESAQTAQDAIKALNSKLLAGSGPDVIVLDGAPMERYASQGLLAELPEGIIDSMFSSVAAPYKKGVSYYAPSRFSFPALFASESDLSKASNLSSIISLAVDGKDAAPRAGMREALPEGERPALSFQTLKEAFDVIWKSSAPSVITEGNKIDEGALTEIVSSVKALNDKYKLSEASGGGGVRMAMVRAGGSAAQISGSLISYISGQAVYGAINASSIYILQALSDMSSGGAKPFPGIGSNAWGPKGILGVSSASKKKDAAFDLVKLAFSDAVQSQDVGDGLPVTSSGLKAQVSSVNTMLANMGRGSFNYDIESAIASLGSPQPLDSVVSDAVWAQSESCAKGEIDVNQAVKKIGQTLSTYLAEMQ